MPSAPFPLDDPHSWDRAILGGIALPGRVSVEGLKVASRWDIKEAPGTDGATETYKGYTPASLTIRVTLWEAGQWSVWQAVLPELRPRPGKAIPKPFDIIHPATAAWGIRSVIVTEIEGPVPGSESCTWDFVISCREYFAPPKKNTTGTANGSVSASKKELGADTGRDTGIKDTNVEREKPKPPSRDKIPPDTVATENGLVDISSTKKSYAE